MSSAEVSTLELSPKGTLEIELSAGTAASFSMRVMNDDENPLAFGLRFEGAGAGFATSAEAETIVKQFSSGRLVFAVRVPSSLTTGVYPIAVSVLVNGSVDNSLGPTTVTVAVKGVDPTPEPTGAAVAQELPQPPAPIETTPRPSAPASSRPPAQPKAKERATETRATASSKAADSAPTREVIEEVAPPAAVSEVARPVVVAADPPPAKPEPPKPEPPNSEPPKSARPVISDVAPKQEPAPASPESSAPDTPPQRPEIVFQTPVVPEKEPEKKAEAEPEKLRAVIRSATRREEEEAKAKVETPKEELDPRLNKDLYDECLTNPDNNSVVPIRAGGSILVLLPFVSDSVGGHYKLEVKDDRDPDQDAKFVTLLEYVHTTGPNKPHRMSFSIQVPDREPPHDYRIRIARGSTADMDRSVLVLRILPRIEVALETETHRVIVGPIRRFADFTLSVINKGNVATAYRLSARRPSETGNVKDVLERDDRESEGQWHYLFDSELENLPQERESKVKRRFRMLWQGIWWAGLWKKQKVSLLALPVTDTANNGSTANLVDIVGIRWRILPLPWFLSVPLGIAIVLMFSALTMSISNLKLISPSVVATDKAFTYVMDPHPTNLNGQTQEDVWINTQLSWTASLPWTHLGTEASAAPNVQVMGSDGSKRSGEARVHVEMHPYTDVLFEAVANIGGKASALQRPVRFVAIRTEGRIDFKELSTRSGQPIEGAVSGAPGIRSVHFGVAKDLPFGGVEVDLRVDPESKITLTMHNEDRNNNINLFLFKAPKDYDLLGGYLESDACHPVRPQDNARWVLVPKTTLDSGGDEFVVITSDKEAPMIRVKLLPAN